MKALIPMLCWAISAAFIVVPVVEAIIYSPLWLLLLIATFPLAVVTFYLGMVLE